MVSPLLYLQRMPSSSIERDIKKTVPGGSGFLLRVSCCSGVRLHPPRRTRPKRAKNVVRGTSVRVIPILNHSPVPNAGLATHLAVLDRKRYAALFYEDV